MTNTHIVEHRKNLDDVDESYDVAVVIDVYCFSTSVVSLFNQGAEKVHVAQNMEQVDEFREKTGAIGGGEPADGDFEVDNNPKDILQRDFTDETVSLTSDNGARTTHMLMSNGFENIVIGTFANAQVVADYISQYDSALLVCSGTGDLVAPEDIAGAMTIQSELYDDNPHQRAIKQKALESAVLGQYSEFIPERGPELTHDTNSMPILPVLSDDGSVFLEYED